MSNIYWIDLFCGAGGVSLGIHKAGQKVLACVNHDKNAILSHQANHKEALHFTEDIRTIELSPIVDIVKEVRASDPKAKICLWASLECTHFSDAKGGGSRDADSRTLAEHLFRYEEAMNFDYIYIENVEEFMSWGPLCAKTVSINTDYGKQDVCPVKFDKKVGKMQPIWKPESRTKGIDYVKWINKICSYGFAHSHKILNCADYGDPTKRLRYFGVFAKNGMKIKFPSPTHQDPKKILAKKSQHDLFGSNELKPWRPVRECLELENMGSSIFSRKKPLVEKSLRRIYAGLVKYVMNNDKMQEAVIEQISNEIQSFFDSHSDDLLFPIEQSDKKVKPFLTKYNSNSPTTGISVPQDIDDPSSTICTHGRLGIVNAFLAGFYSSPDLNTDKSKVTSIESPSPSITTIPHQSIVFLASYYGSNDFQNAKNRTHSIKNPNPSVTCTPQQRLVFVSSFHGGENNHIRNHDINNPHTTVTTNNKDALVFIAKYYSMNNADNQSGNICDINEPSSALTTNNKQSVVFIAKYYGQENQAANSHSIENPSPTLTTVDRLSMVTCQNFLINPQYNNTVSSIDKPCFTIIARMDKTPPYIANVLKPEIESEEYIPCVVIRKEDSPYTIRIKVCMALNSLMDIKFRMLTIPELKQIQSFPKDYVLIGTQADQKKYIGNAVPSETVMNLVKCIG